jgi:hypothetical protein
MHLSLSIWPAADLVPENPKPRECGKIEGFAE